MLPRIGLGSLKGGPEVIAAMIHNLPYRNQQNKSEIRYSFVLPRCQLQDSTELFVFFKGGLMLPRRGLGSLKGGQK